VGRKHDPAFRVVAVDSRRGPQSGRFLEILGSYNARRGGPRLKVERIKHWLAVGAQTSGTVHNLFVDQKIVAGPKINVLPKRKPKEKVEPAPVAAQTPPAPAAAASETVAN